MGGSYRFKLSVDNWTFVAHGCTSPITKISQAGVKDGYWFRQFLSSFQFYVCLILNNYNLYLDHNEK